MAGDRTGLYVLMGVYNVAIFSVAVYSYLSNTAQVARGNSFVKTHFAAGKDFKAGVLFLTTFSTVFSGYTVVSVPDEASGSGFTSVRWIGAIILVCASILVVYPRLRPVSTDRGYFSPAQFITDRFHSRMLSVLCAVTLVIPQVIYIVVQVFSLRTTVDAVTEGEIDGRYAAIIFSVLILFYEMIGGLRSVALTDSIQSVVMLIAFVVTPFLILHLYGGFEGTVPEDCDQKFIDDAGNDRGCVAYENPRLLTYPSEDSATSMLSFLLLFISFPLNPHMLQRCYSSNSDEGLRLTATGLLSVCFLAMVPGILLGMVKAAVDPDVPGSTFGVVMSRLLEEGDFAYVVASVGMTSAIAAIMSTADSALIGVSNTLSVEVFKDLMSPHAEERMVVLAGKCVSTMTIIVALVWGTTDPNLDTGIMANWQNGLLIQAVPTFLGGLFWEEASSRSLIIGILTGWTTVVLVEFGYADKGTDTIMSSGVWGCLSNTAVFLFLQFFLDPEYLDDSKRKYDVPEARVTKQFGESRLTVAHINKIMGIGVRTTEPVTQPLGQAALLVMLICVFLPLPFYDISAGEADQPAGISHGNITENEAHL
ncbi:hypothetical protein CYMTET_37865 [Cymbomonas tetramitiformis]|uniref:Sodium/solute symporter n=1 Tax=Cymbomonas tetramitiformis TaxID=36881 RepID=A0AAE0CEV6_9CHLO|nr:hypothetical protein CYMTET_37865 [Cymbomonas tetramitiformis]